MYSTWAFRTPHLLLELTFAPDFPLWTSDKLRGLDSAAASPSRSTGLLCIAVAYSILRKRLVSFFFFPSAEHRGSGSRRRDAHSPGRAFLRPQFVPLPPSSPALVPGSLHLLAVQGGLVLAAENAWQKKNARAAAVIIVPQLRLCRQCSRLSRHVSKSNSLSSTDVVRPRRASCCLQCKWLHLSPSTSHADGARARARVRLCRRPRLLRLTASLPPRPSWRPPSSQPPPSSPSPLTHFTGRLVEATARAHGLCVASSRGSCSPCPQWARRRRRCRSRRLRLSTMR